MLGPDDITPTDHATADTIMTAATQRLQVEVITRAHDAGKLAGVVECRQSCEAIRARYDRGVLVGAAVALAGLVTGFGAWWLWP